jgi:biopolymer transport protein ExbD
MKRRPMPKASEMYPNLTPLIDVVMCLIIFFMLAAKMGVNRGEDRTINLPQSPRGTELPSLSNTITLNVLRPETGDLPVVTTLNQNTDQLIMLSVQEVEGRKPLTEWIKGAKGDNPEFKVIIRADENLDYRFLQPVLVCAAEAQVKSINLATRKPPAE